MAHFSSYNTSDSQSGATVLAGNASITPIQIQTGIAGVIAGTIISDQAGTLTIAQSFDGSNWDSGSNLQAPIAVAAGVAQSFNVTVIAPFAQISYTNGAVTQGYMRLFARAFGNRVSG
jgi:hypothetical protein